MGILDRLRGTKKELPPLPRRGSSIKEIVAAQLHDLGLDELDPSQLRTFFSLQDIARGLSQGNSFVFAPSNTECFIVSRQSMAPNEARDSQQAICQGKVTLKCEFHKLPTYPLVRFLITIYDRPTDPYKIEGLFDITHPDFQDFVETLPQAKKLTLNVYGGEAEHYFSEELPLSREFAHAVVSNFNRAVAAFYSVPEGRRSFDAACSKFQREHPLF